MDPIIARCGYRCDLCAARSDDAEVRQRLVNGWRRIYGNESYTAENVRCDGCLCDGRLADKNCQVRACCLDLSYENCAECDDFPCDKLNNLLACHSEQHRQRPRLSDGVYNLCCRQFDNIPRLLKIRRALGLDDGGLACTEKDLEHPDSDIGEPPFLQPERRSSII